MIGHNDVSNKSVAPCIPAPIVKIPDVLKSVSIILWLPLTSHRLRHTSGGSTSQPPAVCRVQVLPRVCRVSEGVAQSVMGDDCGASASAAQSVKESMSSGLQAPSPTKHGCLGGGGGLATAHRRVPLRHVICSFCRCLLESFARWRLSDSLAGSGCPGPSPGHPGCNLGDPSMRAFTRSGLTCPRSGFDYLSLRV